MEPTPVLVVVAVALAVTGCSVSGSDGGTTSTNVTAAAATTGGGSSPTVTTAESTTTAVPTTASTASTSEPPAALLSDAAMPFSAAETVQAALGDLDGDGDLDVVLANPRDNPSTVWMGDGAGGFVDSGQRLTVQGHGVVLADFDGDGDLDAFITCHGIGSGMGLPSRLYLNDGMGTFTDAGLDLGDADLSGVEVHLIDVQGDGRPDVYVSYYDPDGEPDRVYVNDGTGLLADSGLRIGEDAVAWGDLDGDGDVDLFGKRIGEGYVVQTNDGTGTLAERWSMEDATVAEGSIVLDDFDRDGDLDVLVGNGREAGALPAQLLWNDGSGSFTPAEGEMRTASLADFGVADLDGDGNLDTVVASGDRPDEVWLGDGAGGFGDSGLRLGPLPPEGLSTRPTIGDVDGDGDPDVIIGSLAAPARLYLNLSG